MKNAFDIIRVHADETLDWLEAAESLSAARSRAWELMLDSPGEYFVFNQETKKLVAHFCVREAAKPNPEVLTLDTPAWEVVREEGCFALAQLAANA